MLIGTELLLTTSDKYSNTVMGWSYSSLESISSFGIFKITFHFWRGIHSFLMNMLVEMPWKDMLLSTNHFWLISSPWLRCLTAFHLFCWLLLVWFLNKNDSHGLMLYMGCVYVTFHRIQTLFCLLCTQLLVCCRHTGSVSRNGSLGSYFQCIDVFKAGHLVHIVLVWLCICETHAFPRNECCKCRYIKSNNVL